MRSTGPTGARLAALSALAVLAMIPIAATVASTRSAAAEISASRLADALFAPAASAESTPSEVCGPTTPLVPDRLVQDANVRVCVESSRAGRSARAYYRKDTDDPLAVTLSLVRSDGATFDLACQALPAERSGSCETPARRASAGVGYAAAAEAALGDAPSAHAESGQSLQSLVR